MTQEDFNNVCKDLGVTLLDVDYTKFETPYDVAQFVITLNQVNERVMAEENAELKKKVELLVSDPLVKACNTEVENLKLQIEQLTEDNNRLKDSIISIGNVVKENKEKWKYLEGRFVKVDYCTEEQRTHCPLYPLDCQGDKCQQFVDLVDLLDKACDDAGIK